MRIFIILGLILIALALFSNGCKQVESAQMNKVFKWTVPWDNDKVSSYEFRYSRSADSLNNYWTSCVTIPVPGIPGAIGATDSLVTSLNLPLNIKYYFAIKSKDPAGNISLISNIFDTTLLDVIPPVAVTDLR